MNRLLRVLLLLKVLVMLSLGSATAWAECEDHDTHASAGQVGHSAMMVAATEDGDDDSGGDDEPESDDDDEGDSQT
jgi:hypothetical protein